MTQYARFSSPQWLSNGLLENTLFRPEGLFEGQRVLDIGPGVRPMSWYKPAAHLCVEPCDDYALRLCGAGYVVLNLRAYWAMPLFRPDTFDSIFLLDVIEHMERPEGERVLAHATELSPRQIVVYTPYGFVPQSGDAWGLSGADWQEHRSGWLPDDFPGWRIQMAPTNDAFFAIWDRP